MMLPSQILADGNRLDDGQAGSLKAIISAKTADGGQDPLVPV